MSIGTPGHNALRKQPKVHLNLSLIALLGTFVLSPTAFSQASGVNQAGPDYLHNQAGSSPVTQHGSSEAAMKVEEMRQAERHRRIVTDTAKLLELSNQLKAQVDQLPKDQLSLEVIRKAAEIEKIAHDLKEWMKS